MRGFIAPTDLAWFRFLQARPELEEVNFWRPRRADRFGALDPGEVFFFKLKGRHNAVAGFGLFARFAALPIWQAWDVFGPANGVASERELTNRIASLDRGRPSGDVNKVIGCIAITQPVFFPPDEWVPVPPSWPRNVMRGKTYDLMSGEGLDLWRTCLERAARTQAAAEWTTQAVEMRRFGRPQTILPRLGQASFRLAVLDAYGSACAVTTEHSLPVLEAAHIRPFVDGGRHEVPNGLPLRRDIHRLFDLGFVTVRPDLRFAVSPTLRHAYANGRTYYALEGAEIRIPNEPALRPSPELLEWHGDEVFRTA